MLYWLTALSDGGDFFNLFRYITFRAGGAFLTALIFGFLFGRPLIAVLRKRQGKGQPIRDDGPEGHFAKAGTPTMGGLLIVGALMTATLLWARLDNPFVWLVLFVTLSFALIGFADDYAKVSRQNSSGVPGKLRLLLGILIAAIAAWWAAQIHPEALQSKLAMPVLKDALFNLGLLYIPFCVCVIVGAANAIGELSSSMFTSRGPSCAITGASFSAPTLTLMVITSLPPLPSLTVTSKLSLPT